ncbi:MAG: MBL fold metallo-hydrolase [Crocinitomicaceae bacterium]|nr:MBL fold metallo-hydrolase [Crocinitomicaceae bacterium]|tara:strand:- start:890 stop:2302 length:1413 start_codon:yes stop_codon:yes gene_type:complete
MEIKQIYTGCLAQGSYYIKCCDEAAIVDPLREVQQYIDMAERDCVKIKYIFETHFHADFVSGHLTLAEKTGATIVFGPNAKTGFDSLIAKDGQRFKIGKVEIETLHTPGHTMESTTYLVNDKQGKPHAIFSGDTVFLGDVGRPDLAQKATNMSQEDLAGILFESIRKKILPLPDDVIIYPGHGAGSACGKNMSIETIGTLGHEKKTNYALRPDMSKEEFVAELCEGLPKPLEYFGLNVAMNKYGYKSIDDVIENGHNMLGVEDFVNASTATEALILDVRHQREFIKGFIPGSIFIGLSGTFAPWVGALLVDVKMQLLLVAEPGTEVEAITRLSRVGFDNVIGILDGGFESWKQAGKDVDNINAVDAITLAEEVNSDENTKIVDVRRTGEYEAEHVEGASHAPLSCLTDYLDRLPHEQFYIHCAGGYRSVIANSILKKNGIHNAIEVLGGFNAIKKTEAPRTEFVCNDSIL